MKKRKRTPQRDEATIIQPWDSIPPAKLHVWMFNPSLNIVSKAISVSVKEELGLPGMEGKVPKLFWLRTSELRSSGIHNGWALISYAYGWWGVGKAEADVKYSIYFLPTGCIAFSGSLGECCKRMMELPPFVEGAPLDPPSTLEEWMNTGEMMRASQRWEEIAKVLFKVKEIEYEKVLDA
mgnify:CR=1 FL=1